MSLTHGQMVALELAPKFGAFFSLLGSSLIIYRLLMHGRKELQTRTGHRILLAMSCVDIPNSIQFFLSSWAAPRDAPDQVWAVGTQGTCSMQSFFGHLGIAMPMYNVSMSTYYYLTVVHSWRENDFIGKWPEFLFHFFPLGFAFGTGIAGLVQKLYAYSGSWCWIAPDPPDCQESFYNNGVTTCIRGDNWSIYRWAYWYAPLWACLLSITVLQFVMYRKVRKIEVKAEKWNSQHAGEGEYSASDYFSDRERSFASERSYDLDQSELSQQRIAGGRKQEQQQRQQQQSRRRTRNSQRVMGQCLAYAMAAYGTFTIPTTNRVVMQATGEYYFALGLMHALIEPTQGIWNYLVFNRPRYLRYRQQFPDDGILVALWVTLTTFGAMHVKKYETSRNSGASTTSNNKRRGVFTLRNTTDNGTLVGNTMAGPHHEETTDDDNGSSGRTDMGKKEAGDEEDEVVDVDKEQDARVGKVSFLTASGTYYAPMNATIEFEDHSEEDEECQDDFISSPFQQSHFEIVDADEPDEAVHQLYGRPGSSTRFLQIPDDSNEDEEDSKPACAEQPRN